MANEVATLGLKIDSRDVLKADKALDDLAKTSKKAGIGTRALAKAADDARKESELLAKSLKREARSASLLDIVLDKTAKSTNKLEAANRKASGAFKVQKGAVQQAGFQIQDFAVQVAGGQSALLAFGQQGSQLAGTLGPGGAVIGAVIAISAAIGGVLLTSLKKSNDELKEFEGTVKKVEAALASVKLDKATKAVEMQGAAYAKLRAEAGLFAIQNQKTKGSEDEFTFLQKLLNSETELLNIRWKTNAAIRAKNQEVETSFQVLEGLRKEQAELERESKGLSSFDELIEGYKEQAELLKLNSAEQEIFLALKDADVAATSEQGQALTEVITKLFKQKDAIEATAEAKKQELIEEKKAAKEKEKLSRVAARLEKKAEKERKKNISDAIKDTKRLNDSLKLISRGDTFGVLATGLDAFASKEQQFHEQRMANEAAIEDAKKKGLAVEQDLILENAKLNATQAQSRLGQVSQIAESIAGGFEEGSEAGKLFTQVAKAAGIAQAAVAVAAAASAPPPVGLATAAATLSLMSSIGLGLGGGGGSSVSVSEAAQASQGTGSVFGDPTAKAGSLGTAFERLEDINLESQNELRGIFGEMVQLNNNISGLTGVLVRSFGNFDGSGVTSGLDLSSSGAGDAIRDISGEIGVFTNVSSKLGNVLSGVSGPILGLVDTLTGGVVGEFIADTLGGIGNVLFGKTKKSIVNSGIFIAEQTFGSLQEGIEAGSFAVIKTKTKKRFRTKTSYDLVKGEIDDSTENQLQLVFENIGGTIESAVDLLGIDTANSLEDFAISVGEISLHGLSGSEIQSELEAVFSNQANLMAEFMVPELINFTEAGEETFDTLVRLATEVSRFNSFAEKLNLTFSATGLEAVGLIDNLTSIAGGTEKLNDSLGSYYENFFTASERQEDLTNALTGAMDELGFALPETREGFRAIVEGLDLATQSGQEAFVTLTQFSESANDVFEAFEKGAEFVADLQRELDVFSLSGSALDLFELDEWRNEQLAIADATGRGLAQIEELYGLQRQRILEQQTELLIEQNEARLAEMLAAMVSVTDGAMSALSAAVEAERAVIDSAFDDSISARGDALATELDQIKASAAAQTDAIKASEAASTAAIKATEKARTDATKMALDAAKDGLKSISSELSGIVSALDKLRATTTPQNVLRAEALGVLKGALASGNLGGTGEAAGIAANINASEFATASEFARQIGITSGVLSGLEASGLKQESVAQQTVDRLDLTITQIKNSAAASIEQIKASSAADIAESKFSTDLQIVAAQAAADADIALLTEQHDSDTERFDSILSTAQEQLDALRGIDNSVLSVADALSSLAFAISNEASAGPFENERHAPIQPSGNVAARSSNTEFIGPTNAASSSQQNALLTRQEMLAEMKALRAEIREIKDINFSTAKSTLKSSKQLARWDVDGMPEVRT